MAKKDVLKGALMAASEILLSDKGKRFLCGEYTDGTTRSLPDAITGEIISPKDRAAYENKKKKKSGKKKKKGKKKKGKKSYYDDIPFDI